jgi:arylsulfatase A-like enzyme
LRGALWDFSNPAYPLILRENGYRIGHTYKVWGPGSPADAPHGGSKTRFKKAGTKFNAFSQHVMRSDDPSAAKERLLDEVRQNFLSFIDADENDELDDIRPFCYWFGPTNCHRKWVAGSGKVLAGIDPEELKGKLPPYLPDVETVREDFADYLGEVQAFDAGLGVIIDELKRFDLDRNTILVVSGDHGMPGVTRGKCNLYDMGTHVPLAIRWPAGISHPGRVVDDFVSLPDLAPTFLEAAGVDVPNSMSARSLQSIFASDQSGTVDADRDAVFTGRERHVENARPGGKPYPQRAIRTDQFLYIINFQPDRWPMGTDKGFGQQGERLITPEYAEALTENTRVAFADLDASPTKSWVVTHRQQDPVSFEYAVGKRPRQELYDIRTDPHCMVNLAKDIDSQDTLQRLHSRLLQELHQTGDPRVDVDPMFEHPPYTDLIEK